MNRCPSPDIIEGAPLPRTGGRKSTRGKNNNKNAPGGTAVAVVVSEDASLIISTVSLY
jgi:hypothetical protein